MIIGPFTTAMLVGCLAALGWLLWLAGAMLVVLMGVQALRGDVTVAPQTLLIIAACLFAGGWLCRRVSQWLAAIRQH